MGADREELAEYVCCENTYAMTGAGFDFRMPLGIWVLGYVFRIIGFRRGALRGAKPPVPKKRF
jgi:hypothetical protein